MKQQLLRIIPGAVVMLVVAILIGCSEKPAAVQAPKAVKQKISDQAPAPAEVKPAAAAGNLSAGAPEKADTAQQATTAAVPLTAAVSQPASPSAAAVAAQPAAGAPVANMPAADNPQANGKAPEAANAPAGAAATGAGETKSTSDLIQESLKIAASYDPKGRFDPFEPLFKQAPETAQVQVQKGTHKKRVPQTPLERVALSQLKLSAIIRAAAGDRALVEDATGKGYVVGNGTYIGLNSGKVIRIEKDRIVIEEEIENVMGELTIQSTELKIQKPAGEL